MKMLRVTMPDGSEWDVPISVSWDATYRYDVAQDGIPTEIVEVGEGDET